MHYQSLYLVEEAACRWWAQIQNGIYLCDMAELVTAVSRDLQVDEAVLNTLLTPHFLSWCYEALNNYADELNVYGGVAIPEWQREVVACYRAGQVTHRQFIYTYDGRALAVLKPLQKGERAWQTWLVMRATRLDSANPILPVSKRADGVLVIDTKNPEFSIEPVVGVVGDRVSNNCVVANPEVSTLLTHAVNAAAAIGEPIRIIPSAPSNPVVTRNLTTKDFAEYFERQGTDVHQRWKDLQTFNAHVLQADLLNIVVLWQLCMVSDLHNGNILWTVDTTVGTQGRLRMRIIDYGDSFTYSTQDPIVWLLPQAIMPVPDADKNAVLGVSPIRIQRVLGRWLPRVDSNNVCARLRNIRPSAK